MTDFYGGNDVIHASILQPDGKLVVGGLAHVAPNGDYDYALARYNADGSLDGGFGLAALPGRTMTDFDGQYDQMMDLMLQPDGKILAPGEEVNPTTSFNFAMARYNPNGSLDTTFGPNGRVAMDWFGQQDGIHAAALQADGKVLGAGDVYNPATLGKDFAVARYLIADPSYVSGAVAGLPTSTFATSTAQATLERELATAESDILAGQAPAAVTALDALRLQIDGCGAAPNSDDLIVDCASQISVRVLVDQVIAKLGGP